MINHNEFLDLLLSEYKPIKLSPIKWYGGKYYIANEIISFFCKHDMYVEPFFGAGHVLFKKQKSKLEIVNDINENLISFWKVIKDEQLFDKFVKKIETTPPSPILIDEELQADDVIAKAIKIYVSSLFSFNGEEYKKFFLSKNKPIPDRISRLLYAHKRLKNVVIENENAIKIIKKYQTKKTLFYLDPPYVLDKRVCINNYENEMTDEQHKELIDTVLSSDGIFVISNYDNEIYQILEKYGYYKYCFKCSTYSSSKSKKPKRIETIWTNSKIRKFW